MINGYCSLQTSLLFFVDPVHLLVFTLGFFDLSLNVVELLIPLLHLVVPLDQFSNVVVLHLVLLSGSGLLQLFIEFLDLVLSFLDTGFYIGF